MAKFAHPSKLSKAEQENILYEFAGVLAEAKEVDEVLLLLKDLLSPQEAEMLAKRVQIASRLLDGESYDVISRSLKTTPNTIARVNRWLRRSGEGYRILIKRMKARGDAAKLEKAPRERQVTLRSMLERRYPAMYWPQNLVEELLKGADKRKREKVRKIMEEMDEKSSLYKTLDAELREGTYPTRRKTK